MWFKNLYLYQFEKEFSHNAESLHDELSAKPFAECSATQRESMGWVPPLGKKSESFTHSVNNFILLTMARQERLLPASVVREELEERVVEIQDRESRKVGNKEKKELRERIEDELLPRAFTRTQTLDAWIDLKGGWLVINTSSASRAEAFSTLLRKTIGSLPVVPPKSEAVSPILTEWLAKYEAPQPFEIGDECELKGTGDDQGIASFRKHELGTDEVKSNLESGKNVSKLALVWDQKVSFVVGDDLVIKKLKFLDVLEEKRNEQDPQSHEERMDIEFTLMTGELSQLIPDIVKELT
ncbi:recombination-associated protein RdgC [Leucothrix sargassi]|nr:recombination-associated protein RdgC [Leucothrix sargassi]